MSRYIFNLLLLMYSSIALCQQEAVLTIEASDFTLMMNKNMHIKIDAKKELSTPIMNGYQAADYIVLDGNRVDNFAYRVEAKERSDDGILTRYTISGTNHEYNVDKITTYTTLTTEPDFIFAETYFVNRNSKALFLDSWHTNKISMEDAGSSPSYYAFQGSSTSARKDWIRPIDSFYYDKNYMGMNNSDYGGGIPIVDLWRPDIGIAIGHAETTPQLISLPTERKYPDSNASISIAEFYPYPSFFNAGDTIGSPITFYSVHEGDYYNTLSSYSEMMQRKGIKMAPSQPAAYEPIWCAWGYERNFTKDEIIGTLDKVKELGIKWAVVDDGFQIAEGDWNLNPEKFPEGNKEMKSIVDAIHDKGLKAKIWWTPLAADPGSKVLRDFPDSYIYTDEWAPQFITWWNAYYLSPTNPNTHKHTKDVLQLFMEEWGFDGLKMDGQHMNAVPPDHNPNAGIDDPTESTRALPDFFQMIYDEATSIKPDAVIENCPCGTCMSFFNMPAMNQAVSSDPLSSWQIRHKGKTYKALIPQTAYYGDHVELSDDASDFASSFGIGAVLGTKFTYPKNNPTASGDFLLTPEKEKVWKKWFSLYNKHMLSKAEYRGDLYDIGYDKPEAHAIQKGESLFYAFYADKWDGEITFKGLDKKKCYVILDYVNNKELGKLKKGKSTKKLSFEKHLLVKLTPEK